MPSSFDLLTWDYQWNGYRAITYRVPVDWYENRIRMSSLVRRVGRAIVHYLQVCLLLRSKLTLSDYAELY